MGREGVSPVISMVVFLGIVVAMSAGVYTFVIQGQGRVFEETRNPVLETINVTCMPGEVTWWINNTGKVSMDSSRASILVYTDEGLQEDLSRDGVMLNGFTRARNSGKLVFTPGDQLKISGNYRLELSAGSVSLESSCTVGSDWWDSGWDYRRYIEVEGLSLPVTVNLTMDSGDLVENGKMRSDCADVRVVSEGEVVPYSVTGCEPGDEVRVLAELPETQEGRVYLYYGNLAASPDESSVSRGNVVNVGLGPEEEIRLN